jgi:glycosyltransferase involved in cell wall biosynthesis
LPKKLAIITTHPIQYNAPLFEILNSRGYIELKVFYTWGQSKSGILFDPGFNMSFQWDIPLTQGYDHEFIENISLKPGTKSFFGIINKNLIRRIDDYKPDAILIYGWSFFSHLRVILHFYGKIKILFRGDSTLLNDPPKFTLRKVARRILLKWIYAHINHALYVGSANKDYYLKHGIRTHQLHFAPHAIDNIRFIGDKLSLDKYAMDWRESLGYTNHDIVLLFAGKLEYIKAPDVLIKQFICNTDKRLKLIIAGNGHMEEKLKTMASNNYSIKFIDFQNQKMMPLLYRVADIYVLPSRSETWGLAVNEAMACGRPVIVSDKVGSHLDLIIQGVTGFVFNSSRPEELIAIMNQIQSREALNAMGLLAKKKVLEFNYDKICTSVEKIVSE